MSKKTIYIIIFTILAIVLIGLIGFYFVGRDNGGTGGGIVNTFRGFFPFGGENVENPNDGEPTPGETGNEEPAVDFVKKLRKLSSEPVAGAGTVDVKAGTVVRYIEKATGHIFETELFSPRSGRISNTTIPQAYDAVWGDKNTSLIARYLKDDDLTVDTFSLTLKNISTTTENTISGIEFPKKISDVSVFGSSIFYLEQNTSSSNGYISNFSGGAKKLIWNSPIREVLSQYVNAKTVALTTKPEENTDGFLYFVDTANGGVRKILGNIKGLSTLVNDDASEVLYLNHEGEVSMNLYNIKNRTTTNITPTALPEKCAWSKKDRNVVYCAVSKESIEISTLTRWYKGLTQLTDDVWKYDLKNNTSDVVMTTSTETSETIDIVKPILSENEQYLVFVNKRDGSLWSLDVTK